MALDHAPAPAADRPDFLVETHSIDFIPDSARHGSPRGLFPMWFGANCLRVWFIVPIAALGTYGAFLEKDSYLNSYQDFLSFLLYFLVPWTAVNLADFYLVRHGRYDVADMFTPRGRYGRVNKAGMTAYLIGCAAQIPYANVPFYEGPLAKALGGADISWIVGILVAGACSLSGPGRPGSRRHARSASAATTWCWPRLAASWAAGWPRRPGCPAWRPGSACWTTANRPCRS